MSRPVASRLSLSARHVRQGLFALLALWVTLIAAQQSHHWNPAGIQAQSLPGHFRQQTHFSAVGATGPAPDPLISLDRARVPEEPLQPRWVF